MRSYSELRNLFGTIVNNTTSANLTLGDTLINDSVRRICSSYDWPWLQKTANVSTASGTQAYSLPNDMDRIVSVTVAQGTNRWTPKLAQSREYWEWLNLSTTPQSDVPSWYFIFDNQLLIYPTPSTSTTDAITLAYRRRVADLSVADYTTGSVTALTNGATSVTGSGTSWTSAMAGRWIKIASTSTAGQSGDNVWYQIASVGSSTSLTLAKAYQGTTISGSTGYAIGEMSVLPEAYQDLPVYYASYIYFASVQPEKQQSPIYKQLYDEMYVRLVKDCSMKTSSPVIDYGIWQKTPFNPNLAPSP